MGSRAHALSIGSWDLTPIGPGILLGLGDILAQAWWEPGTYAGYSGTRSLKVGSSATYSLYSHLTLKCRFM